MGKAIVVLCPHRPAALLNQPVLGHVGWGFERPDGSWVVGAVEGEAWHLGNMNGFWAKHVRTLNDGLDIFVRLRGDNAHYDFYKLLTVTEVNPDPVFADQMVQWVSQQPYNLIGRNCMDSAYDILRAFSQGHFNNHVLPSPKDHWIPNDWFNTIFTPEYYRLPDVARLSVEVEASDLTFDAASSTPAPDWRTPGNPAFIDTSRRQVNSDADTSVPEPSKESPQP